MPTNPTITITCYLASELLDALDGHTARALGQSTLMKHKKQKNFVLFLIYFRI